MGNLMIPVEVKMLVSGRVYSPSAKSQSPKKQVAANKNKMNKNDSPPPVQYWLLLEAGIPTRGYNKRQ